MNRATAGFVFAGLVAFAAGCERNEPTNTTPNRTTPTVPSTPAPSTRTDIGRDAHDQALASWRRQLDDAKSKIDALRTRAGSAGENVRTDFTNTVHDLDDQADQVQSRLNQY